MYAYNIDKNKETMTDYGSDQVFNKLRNSNVVDMSRHWKAKGREIRT